MTYTPTKWKKGDVVTSVGLNNIEDELVELDSAKQGGGMGYYEEGHLVDQTIPVAEWESGEGEYSANITLSEMPVVGQEYKIVIDGVETTVTCFDIGSGYVLAADIDNPSYPYMFLADDNQIVCLDTEPTADVHVELIGPVPQKINKSFLDDPFFVAHNEYSGGVWTLEETWNDIKTALDSGKYILCFSKEGFTDGMIFYSFGQSGSVYNVSFFNPLSNTRLEFTSNDPDGVLTTGSL